MNKAIPILLAIIVVILLAGGGYLIFQNQKLAKQLVKEESGPSSISLPQTSPSPSIAPSPSQSTKLTLKDIQENIKAAINSRNYQALIGYMKTPKVNFIIMSSSCCEPTTPDDAATKLDYIKDGVPFDFDQNTTLVKNLKAKNERLTNAYIGLSQNKEQLVAFTIDASNQITQIEVSVSYKLYNQ
ncbi:hypothetical protein A2696_02635 [Candidatus Curtissbacteria bacterium RIFCSPHIGHO2_01_FULL_41_13]|uniref:Uncharacterized protein n=2 Tax=Microgenomates group TaxID=1794810 RepID=A0A1F5G2N1_9BACT|nr:MAG: hypothetical protein A2696_02635 [Candidatus Curtissbacteria bacterium RIFCSPHIGHO2_01_FULL_41_13]OGK41567.1 MAG: hypothetical protein A3A74_08090 [Candidatus Roizmanbacteria bacterium RIFCSPLOWO2_01_FULL_35_13]